MTDPSHRHNGSSKVERNLPVAMGINQTGSLRWTLGSLRSLRFKQCAESTTADPVVVDRPTTRTRFKTSDLHSTDCDRKSRPDKSR